MSDGKKKRPFATGSKPGPDAVDQYLEEQGFYRKHIARDASSLFRVISEHVLDIQNYHEKVRQDCASFMEANAKDYSAEVDKNFYNYCSNLRRPRTYGSLLELRAMARMYKRNVILFEPNQNFRTTHRTYVQNDLYNDSEPMRIFYSHKDKHFDVIYTMDYVEVLAECQAIVYDVLYTNVFKLPDVKYAIERMLHDQEEEVTLPLPNDPKQFATAGGEIIPFDDPQQTNCVLKDPKTCHFHNQTNFDQVVKDNKDSITIVNRSDEPGRLKIFKPIDGFLFDNTKSCVRQLLDEKITPFPYKVAKALDPSIYRNTEFELWSENRKEQRQKWLDVDGLPTKQNDEKYWVYVDDYEKNRNGQYHMMRYPNEPQILMDESAYLSLDEESKKKYVVLNPKSDFSPLTSYDFFHPSRDLIDHIVMPMNYQPRNNNYRGNRRGRNTYHNQNSQMHYVSDIERENLQYADNGPPFNHPYGEMPNYHFVPYDGNSPPPVYQHGAPVVPFVQPHYQQPMGYPTPPQNINPHVPFANFSVPPPTMIQIPPPAIVTTTPTGSNNNNQAQGFAARESSSTDSMNLITDNEWSSTAINWNPVESVDQEGNDLPINDRPTLQFYYNLGVRYYLAACVQRRLESVVNQLETLDLNQQTHQNDLQMNKKDHAPPPVPVNTPVTTKPVCPSGHRPYERYNSYNNNNNRRQFNPNMRDYRDGGNKDGKGRNYNNNNNNNYNNQRKDFQFNPNVKNAHKVEYKPIKSQTIVNSNAALTPVSPPANQNGQQRFNMLQAGTPQAQVLVSSNSGEIAASNPETPQGPTPLQIQTPQFYPAQTFVQTPQPFGFYTYPVEGNEGGMVAYQQPYQPQYQQIYYSYQAPQTPIYYQAPQPQVLDGTMNSSDSGVGDTNAQAHQIYQQPAYPIVYPQPIYYPPQVLPSPHISSQVSGGPVFQMQTPASSTSPTSELPVSDQVIPQNSPPYDAATDEQDAQSSQNNN